MRKIILFQKSEVLFTFLLCEVMNLRPVIVPNFKFLFRKLLIKLSIVKWGLKRRKCELRWAFDDWLTFAVQRKGAVMAFVSSKLFGDCHHGYVLAIPDEDSWLAWCHEDEAVLWIINVKVGSDIEDEVYAIFAIVDIKLLLFYWIYFLYLESRALIFKTVIIWVILLARCFRLQDKRAQVGLLVLDLLWFFLRFFHQFLAFRLFFFDFGELDTFGSILLGLWIFEVEGVGGGLNGSFLMILTWLIMDGTKFISQDVIIGIMSCVFGRIFSNTVDILLDFECLLMHVISKLLVFSPLRTRTNIPHLYSKIIANFK